MKTTFVFTSKIRIIIATIRKVFYGEGDHEPGKEPGDIIIQMEEKEHAVFQRHGEIFFYLGSDLKDVLVSGRDLAMKLDIDVYESLCGMKRAVKTLDNREITISTRPGEVSQIPTKFSKMFFNLVLLCPR